MIPIAIKIIANNILLIINICPPVFGSILLATVGSLLFGRVVAPCVVVVVGFCISANFIFGLLYSVTE